MDIFTLYTSVFATKSKTIQCSEQHIYTINTLASYCEFYGYTHRVFIRAGQAVRQCVQHDSYDRIRIHIRSKNKQQQCLMRFFVMLLFLLPRIKVSIYQIYHFVLYN